MVPCGILMHEDRFLLIQNATSDMFIEFNNEFNLWNVNKYTYDIARLPPASANILIDIISNSFNMLIKLKVFIVTNIITITIAFCVLKKIR